MDYQAQAERPTPPNVDELRETGAVHYERRCVAHCVHGMNDRRSLARPRYTGSQRFLAMTRVAFTRAVPWAEVACIQLCQDR